MNDSRVISLGCRLNHAESERIAALVEAQPDLVVVNSCSVTREAVRQNLTIPLQVAGYGDVSVDVRFEDEGAN